MISNNKVRSLSIDLDVPSLPPPTLFSRAMISNLGSTAITSGKLLLKSTDFWVPHADLLV